MFLTFCLLRYDNLFYFRCSQVTTRSESNTSPRAAFSGNPAQLLRHNTVADSRGLRPYSELAGRVDNGAKHGQK